MESIEEVEKKAEVVQFHSTKKRKKVSRYLCILEIVDNQWNVHYKESIDSDIDIHTQPDSLLSGNCIYPTADQYGNLLFAVKEFLDWIIPSSQYSSRKVCVLSQNPFVTTFINEWSRTSRWREDNTVPYGEYAKMLTRYRAEECDITALTHFNGQGSLHG